jgi:hypothetical protein
MFCVVVLGPQDMGDDAPLSNVSTVVDIEINDIDQESLGLNGAEPVERAARQADSHDPFVSVRIVSRVPTPPDRPPSAS